MAIDIAMDLEKHRLVKKTVLERTYVKIVQPLSDPQLLEKYTLGMQSFLKHRRKIDF